MSESGVFWDCIEHVRGLAELALAGEVDATVTNALSKEAINMAGHHFSGHTILALNIQAIGNGFSGGIPIIIYARMEFLMLIYCRGMAAFLRRKFGGSAINN